LVEEIRRAVDYLRHPVEPRCHIDHSHEPHDTLDAFELAELLFEAGQDRQRGQTRGGVTLFDGEIAPQLADGLDARCRTIVAAMARYKDNGADHHAAGPVRFGKLERLWQ